MGLIIGLGGKSAGKAGASSYVVAWDGESTPVAANIPAGVVVTYDGTSYTGTLSASKDAAGKIYLVSDGTGDEYYRYVVSKDGDTYSWVPLGSTEIDLSDYATKESVAELEQQVSGKADKDGSYDTMSVGSAKNLDGRTLVTDSFLERTTGGDAEVANGLAQIQEVKGKSQVWNQLVENGNFAIEHTPIVAGKALNSISYVDISYSNGEIILTVNNSISSVKGIVSSNGVGLVVGHKCYFSAEFYKSTISSSSYCFFGLQKSNGLAIGDGLFVGDNNSWGKKSYIVEVPSDAYRTCLRIDNTAAVNDYMKARNLQVFDLTLLGIDNLTTVEEVEAWLAENIGLQSYYPYNAGTVLNNSMTGIETLGYNLLDPATGKARILGAYSDVYGNYYGITGTHGTLTFTSDLGETSTITPDSDGKFLIEEPGELSVATPGDDCSVFFWWDGTKVEYQPYERNVAKLDVKHIYGKLNGTGELVQVWPTGMPGIGDIKDSLKIVDGAVVAERKVGEVDLGTMNWSYNASNMGLFTSSGISQKVKSRNVICGKYTTILNGSSTTYFANKDKVVAINIGSNQTGNVVTGSTMIKDSSYSNADTFQSAISGVMLYYELATPQTYTDLVYQNSELFPDGTPVTLPVNYTVDNWSVERILPQNSAEAVLTAAPELTCKYSIDAVELLNTHTDEIADLYDDLDELDAKKPNKQGDYPGMAVGSAKTLEGDENKVEDFVFTPISAADGLAKINDVRGKSLVWNQLVQNGNFADGTNGWRSRYSGGISVSDGILTLSALSEGAFPTVRTVVGLVVGHKYLVSTEVTAISGNYSFFQYGFYNEITPAGTLQETPSPKKYSAILTLTNTANSFGVSFNKDAVGDQIKITNVFVIDLTLMFGAGNEPATVEEFKAMFPLPYYEYNEGEIISNKTEKVKAIGRNLWDNDRYEVEEGKESYFVKEGANTVVIKTLYYAERYNRYDLTRFRGFGNVYIVANYETLSLDNPSASFMIRLYYTDGTDSAIQCLLTAVGNRGKIEMPQTSGKVVDYIAIGNWGHSGSARVSMCVTFSDPSRNGQYEPYKTNTIELNLPTLTGKLNGEGESVVVFPDGLKSAGTVYDEIVGNKAIKRIGVVDMGTLSYYVSGSGENLYFYSIINDKHPTSNNFINKQYVTINPVNSGLPDKSICARAGNGNEYYFNVKDSSYPTTSDFKTAMSGVMLYYELETPEEYILDTELPENFQAYKGGTLKQLPENTSEPTTAPMVMSVTYALDAVGILAGLPQNYVSKESIQAMLTAMQSAGIFSAYTMTWDATNQRYTFTFTANS